MRRVVLFALIFAVLGGTAEAACPRGAQCGIVAVPLDHAGVTAGTLPLAYARVPATGTRTGTIVFLAGGPGQAALPLTADVAAILRPLRATHDLVMVDQRGTGESGAVDCFTDSFAECAARLGERRAFYNTAETAHDVESLRVALGVDRITVLGVSYGTKVAAEYARRYPERTAAVVLDSPVPVDGLDILGQLRLLAAPRVLREVCTPGLCRRTVAEPGETLARAVARVRRGAVRGPSVSSSGRVVSRSVTESLVLQLFVASDAIRGLRAGLPAALESLAAGDAAPLLHLAEVTPGEPGTAINDARLLATVCTEARLPWAPDAPLGPRAGALEAYAADRAAALEPFSARTLLRGSIPEICAAWPPTPPPEPVALAGPNVPVLILSGRDDLRTPLEDARRTAAQYPNARLLAVPGVGHSVLRNDPTGCARTGLVAFVRRQTVSNCSGPPALTAAPYAPATIGALRPTRLSGLPGRTLSAITVTLTGIAFDAAAHGRQTFRLPGLRAGYVRATRTALTLHDVEWIRGVRVSGRLDARGRGTVTVSGPNAAPGTVTYDLGGASGTLGGRAFTL
jgi:pimeloyl-ACP methyl ester carboxylesterase